MHKHNWDDLRFVRAVADTGTVSAAARLLGVNHATVLRRVAAFEEAHGGVVFARGAQGYEVMPERLAVIEAARLAASALEQVAGLMRGGGGAARPIRLTSTDTLCTAVLPEVLAQMARDPQLPRIDLSCSNAHRNLGRLEADITLRPTQNLPADLTGQQAGFLGFGVYAARGRALSADDWLGVTGPLAGSVAGEWLARLPGRARLVATADSFVVLAEMAARGQGQAVIPCVLGEAHAGLVRLERYGEVAAVPLWVASHVELGGAARLDGVRRALVEGLTRQAARLRGPGAAALSAASGRSGR